MSNGSRVVLLYILTFCTSKSITDKYEVIVLPDILFCVAIEVKFLYWIYVRTRKCDFRFEQKLYIGNGDFRQKNDD